MKTLLILLLSTTVCFGQNKTGNAIYLKKSTPIEANSPLEKKHLKLIEENISKLEYQLSFNTNYTFYKEKKSLDNESSSFGIKLARIIAGTTGEIYLNLKNKEKLEKKEFSGKTFLVKSKDTISWKLTNESLIIDGYKCFKATKKEIVENSSGKKEIEIVAWYTPEININFGPEGYNGLPGLIIQLERAKVVTYLKSISFTEEPIEIKLPEKGEHISKTEFDKIVKEISSRVRN